MIEITIPVGILLGVIGIVIAIWDEWYEKRQAEEPQQGGTE
jgi:hypothetical protein